VLLWELDVKFEKLVELVELLAVAPENVGQLLTPLLQALETGFEGGSVAGQLLLSLPLNELLVQDVVL
jgi:hypothetical protein